MKFPYQEFRSKANPKEVNIKPMIPIQLSYGKKTTKLLALIDSGADACLFHKSIADLLEIDYKAGPTKEFTGISGSQSKITAYFHEVHLTVRGLSSINLQVGFCESDGVGSLLGQLGFFDQYDITFQRFRRVVDVRPRS